MKRDLNHWMLFFVVVLAILFMVEATSAQKHLTYTGKVKSFDKGTLRVKGDKGEVMFFTVGGKTEYTHHRLPVVDERVKVTYYIRKGHNVGYKVEILSASSKEKSKK
jgi:hypothetical protein